MLLFHPMYSNHHVTTLPVFSLASTLSHAASRFTSFQQDANRTVQPNSPLLREVLIRASVICSVFILMHLPLTL